jgi:cation diffusion facilitator family transporter
MRKSFIINFFLAILKIITSILTNSKVLFADAIHGLSDMSTDVIGLIGSKLASKNPDESHPYGHGKIEYVTSMIISILIISLGIIIFKNSFGTKEIYYSLPTFIFIIMTIIIKYLLSAYLIKSGKRLNSNILIANGTESRFDSYSTSFAFLMLLISYFDIPLLKYADMVGSIIISLFTIKVGLSLFLSNVRSVIGEIDLDPIKINIIKEIIFENKKVIDIKDITLLKFGSYINLIVEIVLNKNTKLKKINIIESLIKKNIKEKCESIKYITISVSHNK